MSRGEQSKAGLECLKCTHPECIQKERLNPQELLRCPMTDAMDEEAMATSVGYPDGFLSITVAARRCDVRVRTLRRWSISGKVRTIVQRKKNGPLERLVHVGDVFVYKERGCMNESFG